MEETKRKIARAQTETDEGSREWPERYDALLKEVEEKAREEAKKAPNCTFDEYFVCPLKRFLIYELHLIPRSDYIPCHVCSHLFELGTKHKEETGEYQFSSVQREILDELELCRGLSKERKIANPSYSKNTNFVRKRAAKKLEKHCLVLVRMRPEPHPTSPKRWVKTAMATLTLLGAIIANKVSKRVRDNPKVLLLEPDHTAGWYLKLLTDGKDSLARAAQIARKRARNRARKRAGQRLAEKQDTLDEVVQTLMAMLIEIGTLKDRAEKKPTPEDPYADATRRMREIQGIPELTPGTAEPS